MKALIDLGEPMISLESTGDDNPLSKIPLMLVAWYHGQVPHVFQKPMREKIALLLERGASVESRNSRGDTCLSLVIGYNKDDYYSKVMARNSLMDVLVLMISAKADVCAINFHGESVSDIAFASEHGEVWTEALKYCAIDIKDVLSRRNANSAYSSALNPQYHQDSTRAVTSKLSLAEYLERRNVVEEEVACADVNSESDDTQKTRN